jgi:hypothetical protein
MASERGKHLFSYPELRYSRLTPDAPRAHGAAEKTRAHICHAPFHRLQAVDVPFHRTIRPRQVVQPPLWHTSAGYSGRSWPLRHCRSLARARHPTGRVAAFGSGRQSSARAYALVPVPCSPGATTRPGPAARWCGRRQGAAAARQLAMPSVKADILLTHFATRRPSRLFARTSQRPATEPTIPSVSSTTPPSVTAAQR